MVKLALLILAMTALGGAGSAWAGPASEPQEEDFATETPHTGYGAFHEDAEEDAQTEFLQNGRLIGVSVGMGFELVDGQRGRLYEGGFPLIDAKVLYWFNHQLALDLGFAAVSHSFDTDDKLGGHWKVGIFRVGADLRYQFDTRNLAAPISFANPYILAGIGQMTKTQKPSSGSSAGVSESERSFCTSLGLGFEFALVPKTAYFQLESKAHFTDFGDSTSHVFDKSNGIDGLDGRFYTFSGNFLFTW